MRPQRTDHRDSPPSGRGGRNQNRLHGLASHRRAMAWASAFGRSGERHFFVFLASSRTVSPSRVVSIAGSVETSTPGFGALSQPPFGRIEAAVNRRTGRSGERWLLRIGAGLGKGIRGSFARYGRLALPWAQTHRLVDPATVENARRTEGLPRRETPRVTRTRHSAGPQLNAFEPARVRVSGGRPRPWTASFSVLRTGELEDCERSGNRERPGAARDSPDGFRIHPHPSAKASSAKGGNGGEIRTRSEGGHRRRN